MTHPLARGPSQQKQSQLGKEVGTAAPPLQEERRSGSDPCPRPWPQTAPFRASERMNRSPPSLQEEQAFLTSLPLLFSGPHGAGGQRAGHLSPTCAWFF